MWSRIFHIPILFAAFVIVFGDDRHDDELDEIELSDDHLRKVHQDLDTNGDSKVSHEELLAFAHKQHKKLELGHIDVEEEMRHFDTSGDGRISLAEWLHSSLETFTEVEEATDANQDAEQEKQRTHDAELYRAQDEALFKAADKDSDGFVNKDELPALLVPQVHEHTVGTVVQSRLKEADSNDDGKIDFDEFSSQGFASLVGESHEEVVEEDENGNLKYDEEEEAEMKSKDKKLFDRVDTNGDGFLDAEELKPLESGKVGQELIVSKFVMGADKNGDRHIDAEELVSGKDQISDSDIHDHLISWAMHRKIVV